MPDAYYCQWFSSLFSGNFFQLQEKELSPQETKCFRPLSRGLFSIRENSLKVEIYDVFSSPFSGTFFNACLRSPSPSALASAFAAGMRGSLHQALSFGDEMPIFPGRAGIGGDLQ